MDGIIVANGNFINYEELKKSISKGSFLIAVDGGLDHILKIGKKPDIVIGDLDSLDENSKRYLNENDIKVEKFPSDKDYTDLELAIYLAKEQNIKNLEIFGATGTRLDHSFGNLMLLKKINKLNINGKLIDLNNEVYYTDSELTIEKRENYFLSIIALNPEGIIADLEGLKYSKKAINILQTDTLGISNEIISDKGKINILEGEAFVFYSRD